MADSGEDGPTDLLAELVASICLSAKEEEALFKEDITQSFFNAVEAWQAMWLTVQGETSPLNLEKLFYQPMDMLKQLLLTGLVCSCHSQVMSYPARLYTHLISCVTGITGSQVRVYTAESVLCCFRGHTK